MPSDDKLQELIINTLTPEQFAPIIPSDSEIYLVEDDAEYATIEELAEKQDIITDLTQIRNNASTGAGLAPQVAVNTQRIEDLTTAKFPNVVIIGTPHIEGGQVSNYSDTSYLQFPFVDISRGQPFDIYFSFTTSNDITTQQNILDSHFGIALAIQNGKGIMALSSNGTNWDIGTSTGTNTLLPNTTYYVKYSWTGTQYQASLSTNDTEYVPDMNLTSSLSPYKTTIFIGGSPNLFGPNTAHPFKGTINFNKSKVVVNEITVWEGMADVGLASRANVSLNNLDEVGEARFTELQNTIDDKQDKLTKENAGDNINITYRGGGSVLPQGYVQYTFMESTGNQVVDAGTVSNGEWVEIVFSPTVISGTASGAYTGVAGKNNAPQMGYYPGGWTSGNAGSAVPYPPEIARIYTYKWTSSDGRFYIDDVWTNLTRSGILALNLFQCESASRPTRIYEVRKYNANNELVLHLYPALEDSSFRNGMYDIVNNVFYPSNNSLTPGEKIQGENIIISADLSEYATKNDLATKQDAVRVIRL